MSVYIKQEGLPDIGFNHFLDNLAKIKAQETTRTGRVHHSDTWSIEQRKKFFLDTPTDSMRESMKKHYNAVVLLFDTAKSGDDCWLHPYPPEKQDGTPRGVISLPYRWRDDLNRIHVYSPNFGIIARILNCGLSKEEIEGVIYNAWHASHRCGNSTCCNWKHFKIEPGPVNSSRNGCLRHGSLSHVCTHTPVCLTEKTRKLLLTQSIRDKIRYCVQTAIRNNSFKCFTTETMDIVDESQLMSYGLCSICKKAHPRSELCLLLDTQSKCEALLAALKTCQERTADMLAVICNLEQMRVDLGLRDRLELLAKQVPKAPASRIPPKLFSAVGFPGLSLLHTYCINTNKSAVEAQRHPIQDRFSRSISIQSRQTYP